MYEQAEQWVTHFAPKLTRALSAHRHPFVYVERGKIPLYSTRTRNAMNKSSYNALLDMAHKSSLELGQLIAQHLPEECQLALLEALVEHTTKVGYYSQDGLIRVFDAGLMEGINTRLRNREKYLNKPGSV